VFHSHKVELAQTCGTAVSGPTGHTRQRRKRALVPVEHKRLRSLAIVDRVFTGIVRELGRVEAVEPTGDRVRLRIAAPDTAGGSSIGDSVAVNGVCLTVIAATNGSLAFDAVPETLRRSTLGRLEQGAGVNVEPSLQAGDLMGGHFVQGHVDGVGRVRRITDEGLEIEAPHELMRYCVEKGSIAVEGVSLTISSLDENSFSVALVPHTREVTTLGRAAEGDEVNLEVDMLAKYVEKLAAG
jgi:riboflavin synthase